MSANAAVKIFGGRFCSHAAVDEADQIRQIVIAKEAGEMLPCPVEAPRAYRVGAIFGIAGGVAPESDVSSAAENSFVSGKPFEAEVHRNFERLIGDGAFRGPEPYGRLAENSLVKVSRADELFAGIFGIAKRRMRQRRVRIGYARDVRIAQKRQDRMIERRGGDFDLASRGRLTIFRKNRGQQLLLLFQKRGFIFLGEIFAFLGK